MVAVNGPSMAAEVRRSISECLAAESACREAYGYALQRGGRLVYARLLNALLDCAETCHTCADFMLRGSESHRSMCAVCAEISAACAAVCREFGDDPTLQACAEACLRCASACKHSAAPAPPNQDKVSADSFPASDPPSTMARG